MAAGRVWTRVHREFGIIVGPARLETEVGLPARAREEPALCDDVDEPARPG